MQLSGIVDGSGNGDWTCVFLQGDNFEMYKSDFNPLTVGFRGSSNRNSGGRGEGYSPNEKEDL